MTPPGLTADQERALIDIVKLWHRDEIVLIGASALSFFFRMPEQTLDLDISVQISIKDYPGGLDELQEWQRHPEREHEWHAPNGVRIDVLPYSGGDEIVWPESGHRMSMVGHRLAFEQAIRFQVRETSIQVAPPEVVALMKVIAYLERPSERIKDLSHLSHLFEFYLDADDDRRFRSDLLDLDHEEQSAFLLGRTIGTICGPTEAEFMSAFVNKLRDCEHTRSLLLAAGPKAWMRRSDQMQIRLCAFERGYSTS